MELAAVPVLLVLLSCAVGTGLFAELVRRLMSNLKAAKEMFWTIYRTLMGQQMGAPSSERSSVPAPRRARRPDDGGTLDRGRRWHVTEDDLAYFMRVVRPVEKDLLSGSLGGEWSQVMAKDIPGQVRYLSYMRPLPNGTTEYLSVTISPDMTAHEFTEFSLDDGVRAEWDTMVKDTIIVEQGEQRGAEQLVVWLRSFPFGFITSRIYVIARKVFCPPGDPNAVYAVTKVVRHAAADAWANDKHPGVVRIDGYYSMWRSTNVASPWLAATAAGVDAGRCGAGGGGPCCCTVLLHHDEMKIRESLARFAIRCGMWGFVRGMLAAAAPWVVARRARADPFSPDPGAFCCSGGVARLHCVPTAPAALGALARAGGGDGGSGGGAAELGADCGRGREGKEARRPRVRLLEGDRAYMPGAADDTTALIANAGGDGGRWAGSKGSAGRAGLRDMRDDGAHAVDSRALDGVLRRSASALLSWWSQGQSTAAPLNGAPGAKPAGAAEDEEWEQLEDEPTCGQGGGLGLGHHAYSDAGFWYGGAGAGIGAESILRLPCAKNRLRRLGGRALQVLAMSAVAGLTVLLLFGADRPADDAGWAHKAVQRARRARQRARGGCRHIHSCGAAAVRRNPSSGEVQSHAVDTEESD